MYWQFIDLVNAVTELSVWADMEVSLLLPNSGFIFTGKEDEEGGVVVVMLLIIVTTTTINVNYLY